MMDKFTQTGQEIFIKKAYRLFDDAAAMKNSAAMETIAWAHLFGDYMPTNFRKARALFEILSDRCVFAIFITL